LLHATVEDFISLEGPELIEWPGLLDAPFELQVDDQLGLAAQELHQKLHENVQDVRLVYISHHSAPEGPLGVENRHQGRSLINWDHAEDADDLKLDRWLCVVSQMLHDLVTCNTTGEHGADHAEDVSVVRLIAEHRTVLRLFRV